MNGVEILPFDKKEFAILSLIFLLTAKTAFVGPFILLFQSISIDFKSDRG